MTGGERAAAAAALTIAASLATAPAAAFCRTSSCDGHTSQVCAPAGPGDCGTPLFWGTPCIGFWMQKDASAQTPLDVATEVFTTAFATWMNADCGNGAHPSVVVRSEGAVDCHAQEYNQDKGNANIILFDEDTWPYEGSDNTLALTTVTYDLDTGEIYDADMELNAHDATFTTGDTGVIFDLRSIAQHETGHFLGLAHSAVAEATMFPSYQMGDTSLRTLDPDDVAGICAVYPPGTAIDPTCVDEPRHGFSGDCAIDQPAAGGCCTVAAGAPERGGSGIAAAVALLGAAFARARRRGRGGRR